MTIRTVIYQGIAETPRQPSPVPVLAGGAFASWDRPIVKAAVVAIAAVASFVAAPAVVHAPVFAAAEASVAPRTPMRIAAQFSQGFAPTVPGAAPQGIDGLPFPPLAFFGGFGGGTALTSPVFAAFDVPVAARSRAWVEFAGLPGRPALAPFAVFAASDAPPPRRATIDPTFTAYAGRQVPAPPPVPEALAAFAPPPFPLSRVAYLAPAGFPPTVLIAGTPTPSALVFTPLERALPGQAHIPDRPFAAFVGQLVPAPAPVPEAFSPFDVPRAVSRIAVQVTYGLAPHVPTVSVPALPVVFSASEPAPHRAAFMDAQGSPYSGKSVATPYCCVRCYGCAPRQRARCRRSVCGLWRESSPGAAHRFRRVRCSASGRAAHGAMAEHRPAQAAASGARAAYGVCMASDLPPRPSRVIDPQHSAYGAARRLIPGSVDPLFIATGRPVRLVALGPALRFNALGRVGMETNVLAPPIAAGIEIRPVTFDFGLQLAPGVTITNIVSITAAVHYGFADPAPDTRWQGDAVIVASPFTGAASQAVEQFFGAVPGATIYLLQAVVATSDGGTPSLETMITSYVPS